MKKLHVSGITLKRYWGKRLADKAGGCKDSVKRNKKQWCSASLFKDICRIMTAQQKDWGLPHNLTRFQSLGPLQSVLHKSRAMILPGFIRQTQLCIINYQWHYVPNSVFHHRNSAGYAQMHPDVSCYSFPLHTLVSFEWSNSWRYWPSVWPCSRRQAESSCKFWDFPIVELSSYFWLLQILTMFQYSDCLIYMQ